MKLVMNSNNNKLTVYNYGIKQIKRQHNFPSCLYTCRHKFVLSKQLI